MERPAWLDLAHRKLDAAVFDAYDWPHNLTDEQILERLLALNLERAAQQPLAGDERALGRAYRDDRRAHSS